jgi:hypothetical protein
MKTATHVAQSSAAILALVDVNDNIAEEIQRWVDIAYRNGYIAGVLDERIAWDRLG